jgi:hypothetical protein
MDDDAEIQSLMTDLEGLFQGGTTFNTPSNAVPTQQGVKSNIVIQAPIKGTFQNSGNFSFNATDPRHPTGHMGVDMRAPAGTAIYPFASGVVTNVGTNPKGGNTISIQHGDGFRTYYAHLATAKVQKGDRVDNNTVIGTVGTSGNAAGTWPHLHFQVWKDNQIQNPARYFSVPPFSDLSREEKQHGPWLSDQSKQETAAFTMKDHLTQRSLAFSEVSNKLLKVARRYQKLARQS